MEPNNNPIANPTPQGGVDPNMNNDMGAVGVQPTGAGVPDLTTAPASDSVTSASLTGSTTSTPPVSPMTPTAPPVFNPAVSGAAPVNPVVNPTGAAPVAPTFQPGGVGIAATDPIMTPEPLPEPDPIEEELKAPMKAAGPAPGSIGSAVSGPANGMNADNPFGSQGDKTQSVAFNDPAAVAMGGMNSTLPPKPKNIFQDKKALTIMVAVAGVIIVILIVILIMQMMSNNNSSAPSQNNSSSQNVTPTPTPSYTDTLSCTRNMTVEEVAQIRDAVSGTINVSAEFDNGRMEQISLVKSVVYQDDNKSDNEPVEMEVHEAVVDDLDAENAETYYLPVDSNDKVSIDIDSIQENYENLEFICELL